MSDHDASESDGGEAPCLAHLLRGLDGVTHDTALAQLAHELADALVIADPDRRADPRRHREVARAPAAHAARGGLEAAAQA